MYAIATTLTYLALYAILAALLSRPAHRTLYPLVGYGFPFTGRRLILVRVFSPFVLLGIGLYRLPMMMLLVLVAIALGAGGRR